MQLPQVPVLVDYIHVNHSIPSCQEKDRNNETPEGISKVEVLKKDALLDLQLLEPPQVMPFHSSKLEAMKAVKTVTTT